MIDAVLDGDRRVITDALDTWLRANRDALVGEGHQCLTTSLVAGALAADSLTDDAVESCARLAVWLTWHFQHRRRRVEYFKGRSSHAQFFSELTLGRHFGRLASLQRTRYGPVNDWIFQSMATLSYKPKRAQGAQYWINPHNIVADHELHAERLTFVVCNLLGRYSKYLAPGKQRLSELDGYGRTRRRKQRCRRHVRR